MNTASKLKQILIHGMVLILVGLLWGLVVPHTPYPRLALTAHIQFESNGMMYVVMAILLSKMPSRVGSKSIWVVLLSAWLTWIMLASEVANAWWGTNQLLPIAAHQAGAVGAVAWQERVVTLAHISTGLSLIVAWTLIIIGFVKVRESD